jgi:ketosteroid isomerase-like protein
MSQEKVQAIRDAFRIFNESGVAAATDAFEDLLDPAFRLGEASEVPDRETHSGKGAFIANLAKLEESFDALQMEPIEIEDLEDQIVVVVSMTARGRGSDVPVETTFAQLWSLRNGRAVTLLDYATKAEALEAAGHPE